MYADGTTSGSYSSFAGDGNSASGPKVAHIDASRSSSVYGNSDTVQPKAVRYRAMIQLAVSATDQAFETCTGVLADVADLKQNKVTKGHEVVEFQAPTAQNNYAWYRKYADGWVEQGGYVAVLGQQNTTITLPVEMADTNYVVQITNDFNDASNQYGSQCNGRSTTQIIIKCGSYSSGDQMHANWQVNGMSAS